MNLFEPTHLLILGIVVLVLFGPKKIPEFMRGLGQGMGELKKGLDEGKKQLASAMEATETSSSATNTPAASPVAGAVAATDTSHTFIPHDAGAKASDSTVHATSEPTK